MYYLLFYCHCTTLHSTVTVLPCSLLSLYYPVIYCICTTLYYCHCNTLYCTVTVILTTLLSLYYHILYFCCITLHTIFDVLPFILMSLYYPVLYYCCTTLYCAVLFVLWNALTWRRGRRPWPVSLWGCWAPPGRSPGLAQTPQLSPPSPA